MQTALFLKGLACSDDEPSSDAMDLHVVWGRSSKRVTFVASRHQHSTNGHHQKVGDADERRGYRRTYERAVVYDVGFNIGQDTAFYLSRAIAWWQLRPIQPWRTLGARNSVATFKRGISKTERWYRPRRGWPSSGSARATRIQIVLSGIAERNGYSSHPVRIPTTRFVSILRRFGTPDFLKIDIEGNGMLCLEDLTSGVLPKYISIESECPVDAKPITAADGLRALYKLRDLGYHAFKLIDQFTFCSISVPPSLNYLIDSASRKWLTRAPLIRRDGCLSST